MVSDAYDFWLFDLDGTLVDTEWSYTRERFDLVGDRLERPFTDREAEILWHGLGGSRDRQLREWDIDPDTFWTAFHAIEDPQARAEATYLYPDAERLLADIDRPVGLVTHCQQFLADPVLDRLDIRDWFDSVVCCTEQLGWKPDPAPVEHAIRGLDLAGATRNGVLAGDAASDIGAAWNAGLDGVHVERHDPARRGHCVLGDVRVESFDDLYDAVPTQASD
jgi:phosphoglycolate phosphatase